MRFSNSPVATLSCDRLSPAAVGAAVGKKSDWLVIYQPTYLVSAPLRQQKQTHLSVWSRSWSCLHLLSQTGYFSALQNIKVFDVLYKKMTVLFSNTKMWCMLQILEVFWDLHEQVVGLIRIIIVHFKTRCGNITVFLGWQPCIPNIQYVDKTQKAVGRGGGV